MRSRSRTASYVASMPSTPTPHDELLHFYRVHLACARGQPAHRNPAVREILFESLFIRDDSYLRAKFSDLFCQEFVFPARNQCENAEAVRPTPHHIQVLVPIDPVEPRSVRRVTLTLYNITDFWLRSRGLLTSQPPDLDPKGAPGRIASGVFMRLVLRWEFGLPGLIPILDISL